MGMLNFQNKAPEAYKPKLHAKWYNETYLEKHAL